MNIIKRFPSEDDEQALTVSWFRLQYPDKLIFSVPNGGNRNKIEAAKLKRTGALAGIPDLIILSKNEVIFVEMKRQKGGRLSTVQKAIHNILRKLGFNVFVCFGFKDAQKQISDYFNN